MNRIVILLFLAFIGSLHTGLAQPGSTDEQLADYYFNAGDFERARIYYEKIWKNNKTTKVYENYKSTLLALEDAEAAEDLIKKKLKDSRDKSIEYAELGALYKTAGRIKDSESAFKSAVEAMEPTRSGTTRLANKLINIAEYEMAEQAYLKGRKTGHDGYTYNYEMSNLLGIMGRTDEMLEAFLDLIIESPNYIQTVQNSINRNLNIQEDDASAEKVRIALIKRVQKYPDLLLYSEMLIWLLGLRNEFDQALIQAIAIDKRTQEDGSRVINIGQLAANSEDLETAEKAFNYVLTKGKSNEYYLIAATDLLKVRQKILLTTPQPSPDQIALLEAAYQNGLTDLGKKPESASFMIDYAHFLAFHAKKNLAAKLLLDEVIGMPGAYARVRAQAKIKLADILTLENDVWEASLLYSQVELDFKEDPIGHEAKFRNAKIAFYTGDFEWAQAQLNVLKASTSKLISNDAISLSLLITDNFAMDTLTLPMALFARAELHAFQNRTDSAMAGYDYIMTTWPGHSLTDEIYWRKQDINFKLNMPSEALHYLEQIIVNHYDDLLADDALFRKAEITERILKDEKTAMSLYELLINDFPSSLYVVEARKRFRRLRGDSIN